MDRKKRAVIIKLKDQASRKCTEILQKQEEMKMGTIKIPAADVLKKIYGETEESSARYTNLAVNFEKKYHHDKAEFFTAPGLSLIHI